MNNQKSTKIAVFLSGKIAFDPTIECDTQSKHM